MTPDWQLPPGTDRGLWDYVRNAEVARDYDAALAGTPLLEVDLPFAERWLQPPGRLIDLGCGTGRLLISFAQRGYSCVGVDLSEAMLAQARAKADRAGATVELVKANLVELDVLPAAAFDHAACLFSTFGLIRGRANRQRMLGHVRRIVRPGGRFVLHVHNRWFHSWNPLASGERTAPQQRGGALTLHHFRRREITRDLGAAGFRILHIEAISTRPGGRLHLPWFFAGLRAYGYLITAA